nr:hypothetical protein [Nocardia jejuensis]
MFGGRDPPSVPAHPVAHPLPGLRHPVRADPPHSRHPREPVRRALPHGRRPDPHHDRRRAATSQVSRERGACHRTRAPVTTRRAARRSGGSEQVRVRPDPGSRCDHAQPSQPAGRRTATVEAARYRRRVSRRKTGRSAASQQPRFRTGAARLRTGTARLRRGTARLRTGTTQLRTGTARLRTGTTQLRSGAARFGSGRRGCGPERSRISGRPPRQTSRAGLLGPEPRQDAAGRLVRPHPGQRKAGPAR